MKILALLVFLTILSGTLVVLPNYVGKRKSNQQLPPIVTSVPKQNGAVPEENRKTQAKLSLEPSSANLSLNQTQIFTLKISFTRSVANEAIGYLKTAISFPTQYLQMPLDQYIDISQAGLNGVIRVTNPVEANQTGKIFIELGVGPSQSVGPSTEHDIIIARIPLKTVKQTLQPQTITINSFQIRNDQKSAREIITVTQNATVTITKR